MERLTEMNENKTAHFYPQCFDNCGGTGYSRKCDSCDLLDRVCDKLGEYEDLEEQGKLLKLPCAVGDTLYRVEECGEITELEVMYITFFGDGIQLTCKELKRHGEIRYYRPGFSIGRTVFYTKEEAEAALKEL